MPEWSNGTGLGPVSLVLTRVRILLPALIIMRLEVGNEKRFLEFIENLGESKVALISHNDLDGITCPKIISEFIEPKEMFFVDYTELDESLIKKLKEKGIEKVIFTDIYLKDKNFLEALEKFADVLIIDHHPSPDWNSEKTVFIRGESGFSAGYLCYYLFSKIKNVEKWDWLVACSCISDYCHIKPKDWLGKIFRKYGDNLDYGETYVRKSGKFWDLQYKLSLALIYFKEDRKKVFNEIGEKFGEIGKLGECAGEVQEEIDKLLSEFKTKRENFDKGYVFQFNQKFSVGSIIGTILSATEIDKIFITIRPSGKFYGISVRRQDKKFDCGSFLKELLRDIPGADGGGHVPAAGGHFLKKDLPEIRKRLGLEQNKKL